MMAWKPARAVGWASRSARDGGRREVDGAGPKREGGSLQTGMFLLMCALLAGAVTLRVRATDDLFLALDNDSAMRLVQVRDLLAGQGWFDMVQHRLGVGSGVEMHWSRLIDGPLAVLVSLLGLVVDAETAQWATLILWPSLWLGIAFWTTLSIGQRIGGRFAAAPAFFASAMVLLTLVWYVPGSIDHHNVQLTLLLLAVWGLAGRHEGPWRSPFAGLCVASSLVIGVELLAHVAVVCLWLAGTWVVRGEAERRSVIAFGSSLAASLLGLFALTAPSSAYVGGYCDALSADLLFPVLGATLLLTGGAAILSGGRWQGRLLFAAIGGAVVLGPILGTYPACLANPLDRLDPLLVAYWLDHVDEAQGIVEMVSGDQAVFYSFSYLMGGLGALIYAGLLYRGGKRDDISLLLALTLAAFAMACYQVRYTPALTVLTIPAWAWAAGSARRWSDQRRSVASVLLATGALLLSVPHVWTVLFVLAEPTPDANASAPSNAEGEAASGSQRACFEGGDFRAIGSLPAGRVSAPSNLGSEILLQSGLSVLAAPYHRNQAGMKAQIEIALSSDVEQLEQRLRAADVDYVIVCETDPETQLRREGSTSDPVLLQLIRGEIVLDGYPRIMTLGGVHVFGPEAVRAQVQGMDAAG